MSKLYNLLTIVRNILMMGALFSTIQMSSNYFMLSNAAGRGFTNSVKRISPIWSINNPIQLIYNELDSLSRNVDDRNSSGERSLVAHSYKHAINFPLESETIKKCLEFMKLVTLKDIGYHDVDIQSIKDAHCVTVHSSELFDIAAFILPKGKCLPIHDHPGMTVLSKVICGELNVRSFTAKSMSISTKMSELSNKQIPFKKLINVNVDEEVRKTQTDDAWLLTPTMSNYHEFTSVSTCIIFDILLPPYHPLSRLCTYYKYNEKTSNLEIYQPPSNNDLPYTIEYQGVRPRPI